MSAPLPLNEDRRLETLRSYDLLDTAPEQQLDDITLLASRICETPIALISLIDENRQWYKSKIGLTAQEAPRDIAFCAHGITQAELLVVNDAHADPRFAGSPLVTGDPRIRFYAGAPLITAGGDALGMLCVIDRKPRELSDGQAEALRALSRQVIAQFELKRTVGRLEESMAELRRTQESLRLLGSAVEQSRESILITDAELDEPGPRVVFVNPAFTAMTGYTKQEMLGESPRKLQGPRTDRAVLQALRHALASGGTFAGETVNYRKGGEEFHLEWQVAPIRDLDGTTTHFVAIQRDISERKRLEIQFAEGQRMQMVGKLAAGVAHQFNSIMTAIIGQSEMLLHDLLPETALGARAAEIRTAAERAAQLTRQLLAYGRKQLLQPEVLDLNAVLAEMHEGLQQLMGERQEVKVVPAAGLQAIKADLGQIQQVIMNLTMNAVDAMPHGGVLTIQTANATLDENMAGRAGEVTAGDYVVLTMTDTGVGMSGEVKARAFDPFFTTKGVGQGIGLGLSTCQGIVHQSGGYITLHSEPGRGAMFKIYLPQVAAQPKRSIQRLDAPGLARGAETILLVEDDLALRDMACALLQRLGYTVLTAANGLEALSVQARCGSGMIDLLFSDVHMPQMNGGELSKRMRVLEPAIRILFTSTYTENAMAHEVGMSTGAALLQKPYTPSDLACKVRAALDRRESSNGSTIPLRTELSAPALR